MEIWFEFCVFLALVSKTLMTEIDDCDLNITQLFSKYGYHTEEHEIETKDGYLLDLYRVSFGVRNKLEKINKKSVILHHGLLGSAENFILAGPKKGLAFMLAVNGYDVWLMNSRGSWHSKKHKTMNPDKDRQYWQFTWHEIGIYDIPSTIDYVLNATETEKIHYIGHSQGTTSFFVMCSERPEYNSKIHLMIALSPSAILKHVKQQVIKFAVEFYPALEELSEILEQDEFLPFISDLNLRRIGKFLCGHQSRISAICKFIISFLTGVDQGDTDTTMIPLIAANSPSSASIKSLFHYAQIIAAGEFKKYDWGRVKNLKIYKAEEPPLYNMTNIRCPIALFYGESDLITTKEVKKVRNEGFPIEAHTVLTDDNYVLTIHRIPFGRNKRHKRKNRSPVIIVHGMGSSSEYSMVQGRDHALPYYLADRGFDVWLYNSRGSMYSSKHKYYDANKDQDYWLYSYHEIGVYDVTASIDYIVNKTRQKVFFIGHSQGNTCYFIMTSEKPEYNKKIKVSAIYAPSVNMNHIDYPLLKLLAHLVDILQVVHKHFRFVEAAGWMKIGIPLIKFMCSEITYFRQICVNFLAVVGSRKSNLYNEEIYSKIFAVTPSLVSSMNIFHYMQFGKSGIFRKYDFGKEENLKRYNSKTPPKYDLSKATAPVAIFYGENDYISSVPGVLETIRDLPNVLLAYKVAYKYFNHLDFLFGYNSSALVYQPTVQLFQDFDNGKLSSNESQKYVT